jgi:putative nucleotidyltransferase with HDIG domain
MDAKRAAATAILERLRSKGFEAYLVGGCVRDMLMGNSPLDYDVTTAATPPEVLKLFPEALTVGVQFGVVIVPDPAGDVEVATFRSDGIYADGRHPGEVRFSQTAREDVQRRDFTINGLLYDPMADQVLDYVGGQADLRARRLRTIGDPVARFNEDRLRMLRAVRFTARFGFKLDGATLAAIRQWAPQIHEVSSERTRDEIVKILTAGPARAGFELLDDSGLLVEVLPEVKRMQGVQQPPEFHPEGDVWTHTLMMLSGLHAPTPILALGVLLHDVGKPPTFAIRERIRFDNHVEVGARMAEEICQRLRLSTHENQRVVELVRHHLRFKDFPRMKRSTQLRFLRMEGFEEHLELHRLDCIASHGNLTNYELARKMLEDTPQETIKPTPLLRGDDLIAMGHAPGPLFRVMLRAVEDAQLEGRIHNLSEALRLIQEQFPLAGGNRA